MNNQISQEKFLIIVKGGVVQSVYSSNRETVIDVLDFDNEELKNHKAEDKEFEKRADGLFPLL